MGLVSEVHACFQELAHAEVWQSHTIFFLYRLSRRGGWFHLEHRFDRKSRRYPRVRFEARLIRRKQDESKNFQRSCTLTTP